MANEIQFDYISGASLYCFIRNSSGQVNIINSNSFEDYNSDNIANYSYSLEDIGGGMYVGDFNTKITSAGRYSIQVFLESGSDNNPSVITPTDGDSLVGGGEIIWGGTIELFSDNSDTHTWHVAKTGNDSNGGNSFSNALLTVQEAVDQASNGDTIIIYPGDYDENITVTSKALKFIGTNREGSKIVPATGDGIVLDDGCSLENLSVEALQQVSTNYGVYCSGKSNIIIKNCSIYGSFDGIYADSVTGIQISNSHIKGQYDGINFGSGINGVFTNTFFESDGSFPETVSARAFIGLEGVFDNCTFRVTKSSGIVTNAVGLYILTGAQSGAVLNNCAISVIGGTTTGIWAGVYCQNLTNIILNNCNIKCTAASADVGPFDIYNEGTANIIVNSSYYSTSSGTITNNPVSLDATAFDDIPTTEPTGRATTFREMVVQTWMRFFNRVDKTSNKIKVYDEDGAVITEQTYSEGTTSTVQKAE
jgi:hypothetical protein